MIPGLLAQIQPGLDELAPVEVAAKPNQQTVEGEVKTHIGDGIASGNLDAPTQFVTPHGIKHPSAEMTIQQER